MQSALPKKRLKRQPWTVEGGRTYTFSMNERPRKKKSTPKKDYNEETTVTRVRLRMKESVCRSPAKDKKQSCMRHTCTHRHSSKEDR